MLAEKDLLISPPVCMRSPRCLSFFYYFVVIINAEKVNKSPCKVFDRKPCRVSNRKPYLVLEYEANGRLKYQTYLNRLFSI